MLTFSEKIKFNLQVRIFYLILLDFLFINNFDFFDFLLTFPAFRRYCTHFTQKSRVQIPEVSERFDASFSIFSLTSKKKLFAFYETASFQFQFSLCQHAVRSCPLAEHLPHPAVNVHLIDRLQPFRRHHVANLPLRRALSAVHQHSVRAVLSGEAQIMHDGNHGAPRLPEPRFNQ